MIRLSSRFLRFRSYFRFPFDVDHLVGFLIAIVIIYGYLLNLSFLTMAAMMIAIGPNLILTSITEDIKYSLHTLNKKAKISKKEAEIVQQLIECIQFHAIARKLS